MNATPSAEGAMPPGDPTQGSPRNKDGAPCPARPVAPNTDSHTSSIQQETGSANVDADFEALKALFAGLHWCTAISEEEEGVSTCNGEDPPALTAALALAAKGWHVFPCHTVVDGKCTCHGRTPKCSPGKHPATPRGEADATMDEAMIRQWDWRDRNIGVATGPSRRVVIDVDVKEGIDGFDSLRRLLADQGQAFPKTVTTLTGSGGHHYHFGLPNGAEPIKSMTGVLGDDYPGIDTRAATGYVIVPPGSNLNGVYTWLEGCDPWSVPVAECPDWLLKLLPRKGDRKPAAATGAKSSRVQTSPGQDNTGKSASAVPGGESGEVATTRQPVIPLPPGANASGGYVPGEMSAPAPLKVLRQCLKSGRQVIRHSRFVFRTNCPGHHMHGDDNPSLWITYTHRRVLLHCFVCNSQPLDDILDALNLKRDDLFDKAEGPWDGQLPRDLADMIIHAERAQSGATDESPRFKDSQAAINWLGKHIRDRGSSPQMPTHEFSYCDGSGQPLFTVLRIDYTGANGKGKEIRPFHPCPSEFFPDMISCGYPEGLPLRPIYNLPGVLAVPMDAPVYVVEGELKCHKLNTAGVLAVTSAGGANAPDKTDWGSLAGRTIVLLPDADAPGRAYAQHVTNALRQVGPGTSVKVVHLYGETASDSRDVADWLEEGHTVEELKTLADGTKPVSSPTNSDATASHGGAGAATPGADAAASTSNTGNVPSEGASGENTGTYSAGGDAKGATTGGGETAGAPTADRPHPRKRLLGWDEWISQPPTEWLVEMMAPTNAEIAIVAPAGHKKTFIASALAASVASRTAFFGMPVRGGGVVYVASEDPAGVMERIKAFALVHRIPEDLLRGTVTCWRYGFDATDDAQIGEMIDAILDYYKDQPPVLIIFDTLSRCRGSANENDASEMQDLMNRVNQLRYKFGCTLCYVHHTGKDVSRGARGSSVISANLDNDWLIKTELQGEEPNKGTIEPGQKSRRGPRFDPIKFELVPVPLPGGGESAAIVPADVDAELTESEYRILDTLAQEPPIPGRPGVLFEDWKAAAKRRKCFSFEKIYRRLVHKQLTHETRGENPASGRDAGWFSVTQAGREALNRYVEGMTPKGDEIGGHMDPFGDIEFK